MTIVTENEIKKIISNIGLNIQNSKQNKTVIFDASVTSRVFNLYNKLNPILKTKMSLKNEKDDSDKIDRHKIASIILVSIIYSEPFNLNDSSNTDNVNYLEKNAKYLLAIRVALAILYFFDKRKEYKHLLKHKYINTELVRLIHSNSKLVKNICELKINVGSLFFYSHIFYHIEEYISA